MNLEEKINLEKKGLCSLSEKCVEVERRVLNKGKNYITYEIREIDLGIGRQRYIHLTLKAY